MTVAEAEEGQRLWRAVEAASPGSLAHRQTIELWEGWVMRHGGEIARLAMLDALDTEGQDD